MKCFLARRENRSLRRRWEKEEILRRLFRGEREDYWQWTGRMRRGVDNYYYRIKYE